MVPGLGDKSYEDRLRDLKLPTLTYRRIRGDMIEVLNLLMACITSIVQICSHFEINQKESLEEIRRNCSSTEPGLMSGNILLAIE